jgi:GTPase SAR1 family protein
VETVELKNIRLSVWDIGGQEKIRNLWRVRKYTECDVILWFIFVPRSFTTKEAMPLSS